MDHIPLIRGSYLLLYTMLLREVGAPVERELHSAQLPVNIEEEPRAFVSNVLFYKFIRDSSRRAGIDDIAYHAAQRFSLDMLPPNFHREAALAKTGLEFVQCFNRYARNEVTVIDARLLKNGRDYRAICSTDTSDQKYSEWMRIMALILVVRSFAGADWCPSEITFVSRLTPCREAFEEFGNTRMLFGQRHSSITIPIPLLLAPINRRQHSFGSAGEVDTPVPTWRDGSDGFVNSLCMAIRPFLSERPPGVVLAAEMAGTSVRTLQRQLARYGRTYSKLVAEVRFEMARELLNDRFNKTIDIAIAVGYEDPSHFSRAFRRYSGISPREYRNCQIKAPRLVRDGHDMAPMMTGPG